MLCLNFIFTVFSTVILTSSATKVIELSDRFLELRGESTWIIMFYAPWCGHCKKLEPTWSHVAQALYNTDIRVGRVDCTRFTAMATNFKIRGFPTIMYIRGNIQEMYKGDRTREEIIGFALRMASDPVPHLDTSQLQHKMKEHSLFFLYAGKREGALWECFYSLALGFRHFHFFYSVESSCMKDITELKSDAAVMVFKDTTQIFFPESEITDNIPALNESLAIWINNERFPIFMKITHGNLPQLWKLNKYLAIAVVEETKIGSLVSVEQEGHTVDAYKFKDMIESMIKNNRGKYHNNFQFGWTGSPDLANSIAMERLPLPSLIVVNALTMNHYLPQDPSYQLTEKSVETFLDSILDESATVYGGDTYILRLFRMYYNTKTSLEDMWQGNPVLTSVLFGLPLGFLSLICYSIWCSDILDADEEGEESTETRKPERKHEKKD